MIAGRRLRRESTDEQRERTRRQAHRDDFRRELVALALDAGTVGVLPMVTSLVTQRGFSAQVAELEMQVARRDTAVVLILTHRLDGSSRSVGATHVSLVTEELIACASDDRV